MISLTAARPIFASVDAVNEGSVRILEKLGFLWIDARPGALGELLSFRLD